MLRDEACGWREIAAIPGGVANGSNRPCADLPDRSHQRTVGAQERPFRVQATSLVASGIRISITSADFDAIAATIARRQPSRALTNDEHADAKNR
jgi:hypothetical protein